MLGSSQFAMIFLCPLSSPPPSESLAPATLQLDESTLSKEELQRIYAQRERYGIEDIAGEKSRRPEDLGEVR